jgi:hypothetical protein
VTRKHGKADDEQKHLGEGKTRIMRNNRQHDDPPPSSCVKNESLVVFGVMIEQRTSDRIILALLAELPYISHVDCQTALVS